MTWFRHIPHWAWTTLAVLTTLKLLALMALNTTPMITLKGVLGLSLTLPLGCALFGVAFSGALAVWFALQPQVQRVKQHGYQSRLVADKASVQAETAQAETAALHAKIKTLEAALAKALKS